MYGGMLTGGTPILCQVPQQSLRGWTLMICGAEVKLKMNFNFFLDKGLGNLIFPVKGSSIDFFL